MTINPDALDEFLYRENPPVLPVKGADPAWLHKMIHANTGVHYAPKLPPRPPQLEGLALAVHVERCLLTYGMRMGKTKIALDWATLARRGGGWRGKGLVIAHAPVAIDVWEAEALLHSDLLVQGVRSGANSQEALFAALEGPADLLVMSWSTLTQLFTEKRLVQRGAKKGQPKLYPYYDFLREVAELFELVIIDEIHRCKNHMSLWFTIGSELVKHARYRLGLTGTPIGRDPFVIWAQAFLVDGGKALSGSYFFFEAAFGTKAKVYGKKSKYRPVEYKFDMKKMPILQAKLAPFSLAYKLADVQTVDIMHGTVRLRMTPAQRKAYEEVLEEAIKLEEDGADTDARTNNFIKRRQIASGFTPFISDAGQRLIHYFPGSPKLAWVEELAADLAGDVQVIIFYEFTPSGQAICRLLEQAKLPHGWLWSGTKDKGATIADFKAGRTRWLVANSGSGSMAIDLPMADYLLFYESPTSPIIRAQAEARPLSRGSKVLLVDDLVCSPVEQRILGFIGEGKSALSSLLDVRKERGFFRKGV